MKHKSMAIHENQDLPPSFIEEIFMGMKQLDSGKGKEYKFQNPELLTTYRIENAALQPITIGSHENFYRDLKRHP